MVHFQSILEEFFIDKRFPKWLLSPWGKARRIMTRTLLFCFWAFSGLSSHYLSAAVISRDWKSAGDGLLTYDTVNKREWLDLSQTLLQQFPGVSLNDRYQSVVAELVPGGLFEGFTVAKRDDAIALAQSGGIDTSTTNLAINEIPGLGLGQLLSLTVELPNGTRAAIGLLDELYRPQLEVLLNAKFGANYTTPGAGLWIDGFDTVQLTPLPGVFLYRAIPEPTSVTLMLMLGFAMINTRTQNKSTQSLRTRATRCFAANIRYDWRFDRPHTRASSWPRTASSRVMKWGSAWSSRQMCSASTHSGDKPQSRNAPPCLSTRLCSMTSCPISWLGRKSTYSISKTSR